MKSTKSYRDVTIKRCVLYALVFLFLSSLIVNIFQYVLSHQPSKSIIGTYCIGDDRYEDNEYITFMYDNTYVEYHQFNILDQGTYIVDTNNLCTLNSDTNKNESKQILFINNSLYRFNSEGKILAYTKISDTPTLINIDIK